MDVSIVAILAIIYFVNKSMKTKSPKLQSRGIIKSIDNNNVYVDLVDMHRTEIGIIVKCFLNGTAYIGSLVEIEYDASRLEGQIVRNIY